MVCTSLEGQRWQSESSNKMSFRFYSRVTISTFCIFYYNCTQNISLEFHLFIKVNRLWCVHLLERQIWHSEKLLDSTSESPSASYTYFMKFFSKYIFKVQFIYKNNHAVVFPSFERLEMVLNVDFRDIQANEPLPKFGFWSTFISSKNGNFFVLVEFAQHGRTSKLQHFNCLTVFKMDKNGIKNAKIFVRKMRTHSLTEVMDVCFLCQCRHNFYIDANYF